jgi:hypothetical protein
VNCPWCEFEGSLRPMHGHLAAAHPEQIRFETRGSRHVYAMACPICGSEYDQVIKPRLDDPTFVEEFQQEIRLVAFDMMLNHLVGEHEPPPPHTVDK